MTVAAVILAPTTDAALADALGQPRVRRLADLAWSGGAMPVIVLAPDADGSVARALTGAEAIHAQPAPLETGPAGQMQRGIELAIDDVRGTTAVLLWPADMAWVGPETVTSLIEAHGVQPDTMLRPVWRDEAGWPVLLPVAAAGALGTVGAGASPAAVVAALAATLPTRTVDLGDPGVTHDTDTPYHEMPAYEGPPDPPAGHTHEWGEDVATEAGLPPAPAQLD
ncbi:MAG: NTP transferase domain-containing protein [Candidatus Limnocylindria bacterium]